MVASLVAHLHVSYLVVTDSHTTLLHLTFSLRVWALTPERETGPSDATLKVCFRTVSESGTGCFVSTGGAKWLH